MFWLYAHTRILDKDDDTTRRLLLCSNTQDPRSIAAARMASMAFITRFSITCCSRTRSATTGGRFFGISFCRLSSHYVT